MKDSKQIQRALGYIEGVADAAVSLPASVLIMGAVKMIDDALGKEESANEMD